MSEDALSIATAFEGATGALKAAESMPPGPERESALAEARSAVRTAALKIVFSRFSVSKPVAAETGERDKYPTEDHRRITRMSARVALLEVGAMEPTSHRPTEPAWTAEQFSTVDTDFHGRRTFWWAEGWVAATKSPASAPLRLPLQGGDELFLMRGDPPREWTDQELCGIESPYPPETLRDAEFRGGWQECRRRARRRALEGA